MGNERLKLNAQIYDEASVWFVDFRAGDVDDGGRRQFNAWLRRSPDHVRAYLEVAAIWNEGPALDPRRKFADEDLIALSLTEDNVVRMETSGARVSQAAPSHPPAARGRRVTYAIAATFILALAGAMGWLYSQRGTYSTGVGEQHSIALLDGSTIDLNSRSRLRVRFTEDERTVELLAGQALFRVAKDKAARPFVVRSEGTRVRAVGTQFDVYRKRAGTVITVVEGRVAVLSASRRLAEQAGERVEPHASASRTLQVDERAGAVDTNLNPRDAASGSGPIYVSAGEQLMVTPTAQPLPAPANVAAATAWTHRQLVFYSASLAEVAEEFNRYNKRQLIIEHDVLDDLHISGVFSSSNPDSLVNFLRSRREISVTESSNEIRISRQ